MGSPVLLVALDGTLSQLDGVLLTLAFVPAFGAVYALKRNRRTRYFAVEEALEDGDDPDARADGGEERTDVSLRECFEARYGGYYKLGVLVLATLNMTLGPQAVVTGAEDLIVSLGVAGTAFGATVVGLISSFEELFLTVEPVREGRPDIGVGNIVGSMLFFVTANAGVIALVRPIPIDNAIFSIHLPFFVAALLLVGVVFWRVHRARGRRRPPRAVRRLLGGANYLV